MTRSRGNSSARSSARNLARIVVAGTVVAGSQIALSGTAAAAPDDVWDRIAQCESGGKWHTSTGNGYSGGLQFSPSTWRAHGGRGNAANASRAEQIRVAERVLAAQGWSAWPSCSKKVGAKGKATPRRATTSKSSTQTGRTEVERTVRRHSAPRPAAVPGARAPSAPGRPGGTRAVAPGHRHSAIATSKHLPVGQPRLYPRN